MYTDYWKLEARPFDSHCDSRFYYPSESHQATLIKVRYAIEHRRGGVLLAGPAGSGKTLLIDSLLEELPEEYSPRIHIRFPMLSSDQFLLLLARELGFQQEGDVSTDAALQWIEQSLSRNSDDGQHAVVFIDEAHTLADTGLLDTIRLLLNYQPAWTILLAGQPSLVTAVNRMPELEERLDVKCLLRRFGLEESISYICHRMAAAGAGDVESVFKATALETIHQLSGGIPRRINRLCDLALLIGFAEEQAVLKPEHIEAVANELEAFQPQTRAAA